MSSAINDSTTFSKHVSIHDNQTLINTSVTGIHYTMLEYNVMILYFVVLVSIPGQTKFIMSQVVLLISSPADKKSFCYLMHLLKDFTSSTFNKGSRQTNVPNKRKQRIHATRQKCLELQLKGHSESTIKETLCTAQPKLLQVHFSNQQWNLPK